MNKAITFLVMFLLVTVAQAENFLNQNLRWKGVYSTPGNGSVTKLESGGYELKKQTADGSLTFFNEWGMPITPGKSYRLRVMLGNVDPGQKLTVNLCLGFPGNKARNPAYLYSRLKNGIGEIAFTADKSDKSARIHIVLKSADTIEVKKIELEECGNESTANEDKKKVSDAGNLPDKTPDLNAFITKKIAAGVKTLVVPPGVYRLKKIPGKDTHLDFKNLAGVKILGDGVELLFQDPVKMITIVNCKDLELRGFSLDTDPLAFTQGRIVKMSPDKMQLDIKVFKGYPTASKTWRRLEIFDPQTRFVKGRMYPPKSVEKISENILRVTKLDAMKNAPLAQQVEEVGDLAVMTTDGAKGIISLGCENLVFKNITMYSSALMAFYNLGCKDTVFDSCKVLRRDKNDYAERESPRLRSTDADCFHARGAVRGPSIINCEAEFAGDDLIALESVYHLVAAQDRRSLRLIVRDAGHLNMKVNDEIEIFGIKGGVSYAKVISITPAENTTTEEREFIKNLKMSPSFVAPRMTRAFDVVIDSDVPVPRGSLVVSLAATCDGYKVIGGRYAYVRSRGMLLKAGNGIVDGATIIGARLESIKISPEHFFLEAAHSKNVVIKNCTITAGLGAAICIKSPTADRNVFSPAGAHKNIKIMNNDIKYFYPPCLIFTSIDGLVFKNNKLSTLKKPIYFQPLNDRDSLPGIKAINCSNVDSDLKF